METGISGIGKDEMIFGRGPRVRHNYGDVFAGELWALLDVYEVRFASFPDKTLHR